MNLKLTDKFKPLFQPYRNKVYYGGRAGTKSHSFARALVALSVQKELRVLCAREIQKSIRDSVKRLLEDTITALELNHLFYITETEIRCPSTGSVFLFSGLRINPESLKSFEGVDICWIEEAETVSQRSWDLLRPTIRKAGSEIWVSFNPERKSAPVWRDFVINQPPPNSIVVKVTYKDNPWLSEETKAEIEHDRIHRPEDFAHIWEGELKIATKGAYYSKWLQECKDGDRITRVPYEPLLPVNTAWDIGVDDYTSIWFFQVNPFGEYLIIDHLSDEGEGLEYYVNELGKKPYTYGKHIAPHDIAVREWGNGAKSRLEQAASLGIRFEVCPNIGIGDGIASVRSILPKCYFDSEKCEKGLESLWSYQKQEDPKTGAFKDKPLHDWASHDADSFRYLAVGYNHDKHKRTRKKKSVFV